MAILWLAAGLLGALSVAGAALGVTPVGVEFQVNTYTTGGQTMPKVAIDADGDFVVVWGSYGSAGSDTDWYSVQGQLYDAGGDAIGSEFQVNTYTTDRQRDPSVAVHADGDFVVVWASYGSPGSDTDSSSIQGQRYDAGGDAIGSEFQVNTYTTDQQGNPFVAIDADGDFVVVWWSSGSAGSDTDGTSVQGQRYDASGDPVGSQFQVNTYTTSFQQGGPVSADANGDFVVVWTSNGSAGSDTSSTSIQGQRYNAIGDAVGSEFQVNTYTTSHQEAASVAVDADGDFVVAWKSYGSPGSDTDGSSIQGQRYHASGNALGSQFQVNTYTTSTQYYLSVAVDADGDFVVVWDSDGSAGGDTSGYSIQGRRYDVCGNALGSQFQVNTYTTGMQRYLSVAVGADGDFVVVWDSVGSAGGDTSGYSIQGQRYASPSAPSAAARKIYHGECQCSLPGILARCEGNPPVGDPPDVDAAYDYAGDFLDYFFRGFARRSIDDAWEPLVATVRYEGSFYPTAFWSSALQQTAFSDGLVIDDVVAHEFMHGITDWTADLIYQNESGALNESYSDIFGELIDLFNGDCGFAGPPAGPPWWPTHPTDPGTDTPNNLRSSCSIAPTFGDGMRWLLAEDAEDVLPGYTPIRDMWDPTCRGHPDRGSDKVCVPYPYDNGGVHTNSGIPNHAFAMLVDGKTFNGETVTGIGPIKAAAVWYRALTVYLTPASDFQAAGLALIQAAGDLIDTSVTDPRPGGSPVTFSLDDALQVTLALQAVEMGLSIDPCAETGACCVATTPACTDGVDQQSCQGSFTLGARCAALSPTCAMPGGGSQMLLLLDRSEAMQVLRPGGTTRCADALSVAKDDVSAFAAGHPARTISIWTFQGDTATELTAGFVGEAAALAALDSLDGVPCAGTSPLAEAICAALDAFAPELPATDRVLAISTAGVEDASDGECVGPDSIGGPPPSGSYDPDSWQKAVYDKLQAEAVSLVRHWVAPAGSSPFFEDIGGSTGGNYAAVHDDDASPPAFPILGGWAVPALWGGGLAAVAILLAAIGGMLLAGRRSGKRACVILITIAALSGLAASSRAQPPAADLEIHRSRVTGLARFVKPREGQTISVPLQGAQRRVQPIDFLREYGHLFGVSDPERELAVAKVQTDRIGHTHTTYQQYHQDIRVFSAVLKVHQNARGEVTAANGDFHPIPATFDTSSVVGPDAAVGLARQRIAAADAALESTELVIVDPGWYGDPPLGERLAYHIVLSDASVPLREAFFVDAHSGEILDQWSLIETTPGALGRIRHLRESAATEQQ